MIYSIEMIDRDHGSLLLGICKRYFNNTGYAQDAKQEALIKIWQNIHTFDGSNLKAWICRIAVNSCIDMIRRTKRHDHDTLDNAHNAHSAKMSDIERNEINAIIAKCINQLTPRQEIVCKMRLVQGLALQEIALELSVEVGTVKTLLHRSIAIMRIELEKQGYRN